MDVGELREKIIEIIEDEWNKTRQPGGGGVTDFETVHNRLVADEIEVPPGAMADILEALHREGRIWGTPTDNTEAGQIQGPRPIIEPE